MKRRSTPTLVAACVGAALAAVAPDCSSSEASPTTHPANCASPGGPASGAADSHCTGDAGAIVQATDPASCHPEGGSTPSDAGGPDYGEAMYGTAGDDDDCKYHLTYSVSKVCEGSDTTFTVTVARKTDGSAVTGADARADVFLTDIHPAPNDRTTHEEPPGTYVIGPVRFDAAGRWTVRFHFFETCDDTPKNSPHGHGAFYVDVP